MCARDAESDRPGWRPDCDLTYLFLLDLTFLFNLTHKGATYSGTPNLSGSVEPSGDNHTNTACMRSDVAGASYEIHEIHIRLRCSIPCVRGSTILHIICAVSFSCAPMQH